MRRYPLVLVASVLLAAACGGRSPLDVGLGQSSDGGGGTSSGSGGTGDSSSSGGGSSSGAPFDGGSDGYPDFPSHDAETDPCAPDTQTGMSCSDIGTACVLPFNGGNCHARECDCNPPGTLHCYELDCNDGAPPSDGGLVDSSAACPPSQPFLGSPCDDSSLVCSYSNGCVTNCLCRGLWYCATESPCPAPPGQ